MSNIFDLKRSEFSRNVAILATGSGISQIIPLLAAPIVARLYNPNDYAVLAAYTSVAVLLTIIATGMYDAALMLDQHDYEAVNTGGAALTVTIIVTMFSIVAVLLLRQQMTKLTGIKHVEFWLFMIPITVFCSGCYQILNVWNNRKSRYKRLAKNRVIMTITTTSLTIIFGLLSFHEKGLLISLIVGQAMAMLLLLFQTINSDRILLSYIKLGEIRNSFTRHKDFPKYNMPQGLLDGIKEGSIVWITSNFFGANILGSFSFAKNILMKPLQLIGNAFSQVFYREASKLYNEGINIYNFSKKNTLLLFGIGLPFAIIIAIWGKEIFSFIFSNKWEQAGYLSQILIPWLFISFVSSAVSSIPLILKKQRGFFYYSLLLNSVPLLVLYLLGRNNFSYSQTFSFFVGTNIILYIILFVWYKNIMRKIHKVSSKHIIYE
jgi:O-antigen/teichoic acid export membrane protein